MGEPKANVAAHFVGERMTPTTKIERINVKERYKDFKPIDPPALDMAFGAASNFRTYAPMYIRSHECEIHDEDCDQKWLDIMARWFYQGLPKGTEFTPRPGIDSKAALRHIGTVLGSYDPDHGSKEVIVAFLLGLWFKDVKLGVSNG